VPGLPEAAARQGMKLEYMRKYGAFLIEDNVYKVHETGLKSSDLADASIDPNTKIIKKRRAHRRRDRWQRVRRLSDAVAQTRIFLAHAERVEVA
jgi:hypothetical protein